MSLFKNKHHKKYIFPVILLFSILLGTLIGIIFKEDATVLKPFGDIFLNMMFTIVVPLVFCTISSAVANMVDLKRLGKILKWMIIVFFITSSLAAIFALIGVRLIDPVGSAKIALDTTTSVAKSDILNKIVSALTVTDFSNLLSRNNMLPLIIFSVIFGLCVGLIGNDGLGISKVLSNLTKVMLKFIKIIMYYAPIGLCAYFANIVGDYGPELLGSYARTMILYYALTVLYFFIFYTIYAYLSAGKLGVKTFYKNIFAPAITAFATQSSLASLPTNLDATSKMQVDDDINHVVLPIGATMHMDGSSIASILKIAFLFTIFGKDFFTPSAFIPAILLAVLSSVVMSGIPGGGLVGEMLIVSLYDFPATAFPIIAIIGWIVDPPATLLNVTGDSVAAMLISRFVEGKKWLSRKLSHNT